MEKNAIVGDATIHGRFLDSHVPFLQEFPALQSLANKMWDAALDRYNEPLDNVPVGEELEKATALRLAQIIVFYLARASFDCFYDIFRGGQRQRLCGQDDVTSDVRALGDRYVHRHQTGRGKTLQ